MTEDADSVNSNIWASPNSFFTYSKKDSIGKNNPASIDSNKVINPIPKNSNLSMIKSDLFSIEKRHLYSNGSIVCTGYIVGETEIKYVMCDDKDLLGRIFSVMKSKVDKVEDIR